MTIITEAGGTGNPDAEQTDLREQLVNNRETGPIQQVSLAANMITSLHAIMFDLDVRLYRCSSLIPSVPPDPSTFYREVASKWLRRHQVLRKAEVRCSGRGLHALLWLDRPLVFQSEASRNRWHHKINIIQLALPIDPDQPALTSLTRPVGSTNAKNGQKVATLRAGEAVTIDELNVLYEGMDSSRFRTSMRILAGQESISPCPVCQKTGSTLSALDEYGVCYGSCGRISLGELYDQVLERYRTDTAGGRDD